MAEDLPFTELLEALPSTTPFVGPEAIERRVGRAFDVRVGANESAFGISPRAGAAMRDALERLSWYGDPENHELREALAVRHGVGADAICVGAGIDELLGLVVRMVVSPGTPVVTSDGAYPTFNYHVAGFGGALHRVPYRDDREDPEALAETVAELGAPLVYFANPDNPMGTWHPAERVQAFLDALPARTLVVLDEAYMDFAPPEAMLDFDIRDARVVRMRTFSKAHGMAGARIGYAVAGRPVIEAFAKIRNHFGVSRVAQAGALASLGDPDFLGSVVEEVARGRDEYHALARELGLASVPSATNFVAIDVGGGDRARRLLAALEARGVFVRMPGVAPLDRCIRVSVGTAAERRCFAKVFREVLPGVN